MAAPVPLPVVLLHGARTSRTMWRAQVAAVERAGRTALAVDLPGHGTRLGERFTFDAAVAAADDAVAAVGGRAAVVGLSLGGYVGIALAARRPERVAGLVAAGCSTDPDTWVTGAWRSLATLIGRLPDRGAWLNARAVAAAVPAEGARDLAEGGFALDVMVDMLAQMRRATPLADLGAVRCPVWLVNGALDHFRTQERRFLAACPTARLVVVPRATHLVSLVRPVRFTRVLLDALDEVDAREAGEAGGPRRAGAPGGSGTATRPVPSAARPPVVQVPRPHTTHDARGVGHDDDVVPQQRERSGADPA